MAKTFLKAEWRKLAMANYVVDPQVLYQFIPHKTEIDYWNNNCYISLVGFMFLNTRIKGFKIPFHVNFEEVNLRFYVHFNDHGKWKRGVVFIKEVVSKPALTFVANTLYGEHYETMPMKHSWTTSPGELTVEYQWKKNNWNSFKVIAEDRSSLIKPGSVEEFITGQYWGYTKINADKTSEYGVEHPTWEGYVVKDYLIDVDFKTVYGAEFAFLRNEIPQSVLLAEGSEIKVKEGKPI